MMAGSVSILDGGYVTPWSHFASFALSVPITITSAEQVVGRLRNSEGTSKRSAVAIAAPRLAGGPFLRPPLARILFGFESSR